MLETTDHGRILAMRSERAATCVIASFAFDEIGLGPTRIPYLAHRAPARLDEPRLRIVHDDGVSMPPRTRPIPANSDITTGDIQESSRPVRRVIGRKSFGAAASSVLTRH